MNHFRHVRWLPRHRDPLDVHHRDLDSTDGQLAILGHYLHLAFEAGLGGVQAAAGFPVQEPAPGGPVREGPRIIRVIRRKKKSNLFFLWDGDTQLYSTLQPASPYLSLEEAAAEIGPPLRPG